MRLVDKVTSSPPEVVAMDGLGQSRALPGVGARASVIASCNTRYVLDEAVSDECMDLIRHSNGELFEPHGELLRLPVETFWMEWFGDENRSLRPRVGALVESDRDGRRGAITGYWEDLHGRADTMGVTIRFDLDLPIARLRPPGMGLSIKHAEYKHLNGLFDHALLRLDPQWDAYLRTWPAEYAKSVHDLGNGTWLYLPVALTFAAMLNSRDLIEQIPSRLDRLNAARVRRGRVPLLDHVEVQLRLGSPAKAFSGIQATGGRRSPRLHFVRGHLVRRHGKTFWRSAHLRGDADRPIQRKTVLVSRAIGVQRIVA